MADSDSTSLELYQGDKLVGKISSDVLPMLSPIMQRMNVGGGGGGNAIGTFADAAEAGLALVEALGIRDDIDDAQSALGDLKAARVKYYNYLHTVGSGLTAAQILTYQHDIDVAQDAVDRAQTNAQNKATTALWGQVFGGVGRLLGGAQSGSGNLLSALGLGGSGGGGGSGLSGMLLGGGIGALLASMLTGRKLVREDDSNVPPIPTT